MPLTISTSGFHLFYQIVLFGNKWWQPFLCFRLHRAQSRFSRYNFNKFWQFFFQVSLFSPNFLENSIYLWYKMSRKIILRIISFKLLNKSRVSVYFFQIKIKISLFVTSLCFIKVSISRQNCLDKINYLETVVYLSYSFTYSFPFRITKLLWLFMVMLTMSCKDLWKNLASTFPILYQTSI